MDKDKFDFDVASSLIQAIEGTADLLDVKNGQMEKKFLALREGFKDSGYDVFAIDMNTANSAISEIITQLHEVSRHVGEYTEKLRDAV